jgi:hypothetical protein
MFRYLRSRLRRYESAPSPFPAPVPAWRSWARVQSGECLGRHVDGGLKHHQIFQTSEPRRKCGQLSRSIGNPIPGRGNRALSGPAASPVVQYPSRGLGRCLIRVAEGGQGSHRTIGDVWKRPLPTRRVQLRPVRGVAARAEHPQCRPRASGCTWRPPIPACGPVGPARCGSRPAGSRRQTQILILKPDMR